MEIPRYYVPEGIDPFGTVEYEKYDCIQKHWKTGEILFDLKDCEVPKNWSKNARDILVTKYFRKDGIPEFSKPVEEIGIPHWLQREIANTDESTKLVGEKSVKEVVRRLAGHWTYTGLKEGYFAASERQLKDPKLQDKHQLVGQALANAIAADNALAFYDEVIYMLLHQMGAPNSPQFFNTGLWWAYGIEGKPQGHWHVNATPKTQLMPTRITDGPIEDVKTFLKDQTIQSKNAYEYVQGHACFILNLADSMCKENGLLDWYSTEGRIFKFGSGSGVNVSNVRAENEKLSGGGKSSGVMSFVRVADASAGAIKSGGTTRRAAKMIVMNLEHPDILKFIDCKMEAEVDVASLVTGSVIINQHCQAIIDAHYHEADPLEADLIDDACIKAQAAGVPDNYIHKAVQMGNQGMKDWPGITHDTGFEGRAYGTVPFQNANNSVRIPYQFYEQVDANASWRTFWVKSGQIATEMQARDLEQRIALATWFSGDPGTQYHDNINDWNVTPNDGEITASNPCSEHMRLDGSACNLASLNLMAFLRRNTGLPFFDLKGYKQAIGVWHVILDITNTMAHLPDRDTAVGVFLYRDIGLGYANLGSLITSYGLAYDSDEARALGAAMTAVLHSESHLTSAALAEELGAYPRFWANKEAHLKCVRNHMVAAKLRDNYEGLHVEPQRINWGHLEKAIGPVEASKIARSVGLAFEVAYDMAEKTGFRNAEMTLLAPTGTIGLLMDCDTTGVEPSLGLTTYKTLVGGGQMVLQPAQSFELALERLNYHPDQRKRILDFIASTGILPKEFVNEEHYGIFQTSLSNDPNNPPIRWEAHIMMMAAVQPFLSGAISKTVNMPSDATVRDIVKANRLSHDLALKAVAIYRDGSKLSQPLNLKPVEKKPILIGLAEEVPAEAGVYLDDPMEQFSPKQITERMKLGSIRQPGIDVAVRFDGATIYVKTSRYEDGKVGEIWVNYSASQGGTINALVECICRTANIALQHGVPLDAILKGWKDTTFEPKGLVQGHPNIKQAKSLLNLIARIISYHELGDTSSLNVKPDDVTMSVNIDMLRAGPAGYTGSAIVGDLSSFGTHTKTGDECSHCGSTQVFDNGAGCKKCVSCGTAGGCG